MKKVLVACLILVIVAGVAGAGLSVAMLIRAVEWSEWGRVILYSVTVAVCVEMVVLAVGKLREGNHKSV